MTTNEPQDAPMGDRAAAFITDAGYTLEPWQESMLAQLYHGRPAPISPPLQPPFRRVYLGFDPARPQGPIDAGVWIAAVGTDPAETGQWTRIGDGLEADLTHLTLLRADSPAPRETGDIVDLIDAAIGCQHCGRSLNGSPSGDFCSADCQQGWHAARTQPLVGYREPYDLPVHVDNLVELHSPQCTPSVAARAAGNPRVMLGTSMAILITGQAEEFNRRMREHTEAMRVMAAVFAEAWQNVARNMNAVGEAFTAMFKALDTDIRPPLIPAEPWEKLPAWLIEGCPEHECDHRPPTLSGLADAAPEPAPRPSLKLHHGHGPERRPHRNRGGRS